MPVCVFRQAQPPAQQPGVDNAWEQKKTKAALREMFENGDESHTSAARFVKRTVH
jgi:hypothetical protein